MRSREEFYDLPQDVQNEWVTDWEAENDRTVEFDPDVVWYPHRIINRRDEAKAWAEYEWREAHEKRPWRNADCTSWSTERDAEHPHHRDDGVLWAITQDKPADDDWFATLKASPLLEDLVAEQSEDQEADAP